MYSRYTHIPEKERCGRNCLSAKGQRGKGDTGQRGHPSLTAGSFTSGWPSTWSPVGGPGTAAAASRAEHQRHRCSEFGEVIALSQGNDCSVLLEIVYSLFP